MLKGTFKKNCQNSCWMVIYTRYRFEKKISRTLNEIGITAFCPIVKSVNKWADRHKIIESPLFPSYIFVKATTTEASKIIEIPGVINFISNCGKPVVLKDSEIERIKAILQSYSEVELINVHNLNIGSKVKITGGLLLNYQGIVNQIMGKTILMTIEQLNCVIAVKVSVDQISLQTGS